MCCTCACTGFKFQPNLNKGAFDDFDPFSAPTLTPSAAPKSPAAAADGAADLHDPFAPSNSSDNAAFASSNIDPFAAVAGGGDPFVTTTTTTQNGASVDAYDPFGISSSSEGGGGGGGSAADDPFGINQSQKSDTDITTTTTTFAASDDDPFSLGFTSGGGSGGVQVHVTTTSSDTTSTSNPFADSDAPVARTEDTPYESVTSQQSKMADLAPNEQKALEAQFDDLMGGTCSYQ